MIDEEERRQLISSESKVTRALSATGRQRKLSFLEGAWPGSRDLRVTGLSTPGAVLYIMGLFGVFPIVALPHAVAQCGWMGFPIIALFWLVQMYTAAILGRCWLICERLDPEIKLQSRYPYPAVAERAFGVWARYIVAGLLQVSIFGGGIPLLLVASQNLQMFFVYTIPPDSGQGLSFCAWLILLGALICPVLWLGSPKDLTWVAITSVVTVITVTSMVLASMFSDDRNLDEPTFPKPSWQSLISAYGILMYNFDVHPLVLTVQMDMLDKRKLERAVILGFLGSGVLFASVFTSTYFLYGEDTKENMLENLPRGALQYISMIFITVEILFCFVLGSNALFQDVEDSLRISRRFNWKRVAVRTTILFATVLIGLTVPNFSVVMEFVGGTITGPLMIILPPVMYLTLSSRDLSSHATEPPLHEKVFNVEVVIIGIVGGFVVTYASISTLSSDSFVMSCFTNITGAG